MLFRTDYVATLTSRCSRWRWKDCDWRSSIPLRNFVMVRCVHLRKSLRFFGFPVVITIILWALLDSFFQGFQVPCYVLNVCFQFSFDPCDFILIGIIVSGQLLETSKKCCSHIYYTLDFPVKRSIISQNSLRLSCHGMSTILTLLRVGKDHLMTFALDHQPHPLRSDCS